jgi:hypothetical protein
MDMNTDITIAQSLGPNIASDSKAGTSPGVAGTVKSRVARSMEHDIASKTKASASPRVAGATSINDSVQLSSEPHIASEAKVRAAQHVVETYGCEEQGLLAMS